jgi:CDP-diacylglycerol---serine O-phosphatidyltransferase
MKSIPNLLTLLNLFFGCAAVIYILQSGITVLYSDDGSQLVRLPERIWIGSLLIGLAALVDFLDGMVARLVKATSPLGKQLDSLADVVSFGVAPGMIFYQLLRVSYAGQEDGLDISILWLLPALVFPCAAAYRLARFNIDDSQQYSFRGLPSPAAGLLVASLPLIAWYTTSPAVGAVIRNKWALYALIALLSWLMVSNLRLMALKFKDYSLKGNGWKLILLMATIILAIFLHWLAVPLVFIFYIVVSLIDQKNIS